MKYHVRGIMAKKGKCVHISLSAAVGAKFCPHYSPSKPSNCRAPVPPVCSPCRVCQWTGTSERHPAVLVTYKRHGSHNGATHNSPTTVPAHKAIYTSRNEINTLRSIFFIPGFISEFCQYIQNLCIQIRKFFIFPRTVLNYCNYFYGRFYLFFNFAVSKCGYQPDIFSATCPYSHCVVRTFP